MGNWMIEFCRMIVNCTFYPAERSASSDRQTSVFSNACFEGRCSFTFIASTTLAAFELIHDTASHQRLDCVLMAEKIRKG